MFQLPEHDQQRLLAIGREAAHLYLSSTTPELLDTGSGSLECCGIFVSKHKGNELRGRIGNIHPARRLYRTAAKCGTSATVDLKSDAIVQRSSSLAFNEHCLFLAAS
jgi:hypothetical protein